MSAHQVEVTKFERMITADKKLVLVQLVATCHRNLKVTCSNLGSEKSELQASIHSGDKVESLKHVDRN